MPLKLSSGDYYTDLLGKTTMLKRQGNRINANVEDPLE
jgi:hypothetical protein